MTKVALFAFNRPSHLRDTLENILTYSNFPINIYIDGPNNDNDFLQQKKIDKVIDNITVQNYKKRICIKKRSKNLGLASSIISGIEDGFRETDELIIIEDDILTTLDFFKFIKYWLNEARSDKEILSICGYQFSFNEKLNEKFLSTYKMPRFIPWGWATWKEKWEDNYTNNIENIRNRYKDFFQSYSLPEDIQLYINGDSFDVENSDTWSIPWTVAHYLNNMKSIFPSYSLVKNIGFDGSGVHCGKTDIFNNLLKDNENQELSINEKLTRDLKMEIKTENFLISKSYITMTKEKEDPIKQNSEQNDIKKNNINNFNEIKNLIYKNFKYEDLHTHLFPECHRKFHKSGFIELLNYHYLSPEIYKINPNINLKGSKKDIAREIWEKLFIERIPLSTASKGIIKILKVLGLFENRMTFNQLLELEKDLKYDEKDIFSKANIKSVVMTNDPFNKEEWELFDKKNWDRDLYKASLRLDYLFQFKDLNNTEFFEDYINQCIRKSSPKYLSFSLSNDSLKRIANSKNFIQWLTSLDLPIWLMIGVKRNINPVLGDAGDGIDLIDLTLFTDFISKCSSTKFLISNIHFRDEHYLNTLSRNLPNMSIVGSWWYMNNRSYSQNTYNARLQMLGSSHKLFFSDSRVLEQIIYKTYDFQRILDDLIFKIFHEYKAYNYQINLEQIEKTFNSLLYFDTL